MFNVKTVSCCNPLLTINQLRSKFNGKFTVWFNLTTSQPCFQQQQAAVEQQGFDSLTVH